MDCFGMLLIVFDWLIMHAIPQTFFDWIGLAGLPEETRQWAMAMTWSANHARFWLPIGVGLSIIIWANWRAINSRTGSGFWNFGLFGAVLILSFLLSGERSIIKAAPPAFQRDEAQSHNQKAQPAVGDNNTILYAQPPQNMGSGNTIVGPTDQNGGTIINRGGTAIGAGACADSKSVAIGAGAGAGACPHKP